MFFNVRDVFLVAAGIIQSVWLLGRIRPKVVFVKGGFVGVPVGLAAAFWRVPYITHDSDAVAGLANRIIARWAKRHIVAMPPEQYTYPRKKIMQLGVPVQRVYSYVSTDDMRAAQKELGIAAGQRVILVTGGGLGAHILNEALVRIAPVLLSDEHAVILHVAGQKHCDEVQKAYEQALTPALCARVRVVGYVTDLHTYSAAADVIVARAGATAIAEFAAQGKACIFVPSPFLAGGHQLKNAQALAESGAAEIVEQAAIQADPTVLAHAIQTLISDESRQEHLGRTLHALANATAARDVATVLLEVAGLEPKRSV